MSDSRGNEELQQGIAAARAGDKKNAYVHLAKGLKQDSNHLEGWLWLARIADDPAFRRRCINVVLKLDPQNLEAQFMKSEMEQHSAQPVKVPAPPPVPKIKILAPVAVSPIKISASQSSQKPKPPSEGKLTRQILRVSAGMLVCLFFLISLYTSYQLGWWDDKTPTPQPTIAAVGTSNLFVEYILDASGSMNELLPDGVSKADAAKELLTHSLKTYRPEASVGLRVYGHHVSMEKQEESCQDIELVAPVMPGYQGEMINWLENYQAFGMTPINSALQQAVSDFKTDAQRVNSMVLISDGMETCGGDPCEFVKQLEGQGIRLVLHVIGLNVDDPTREQLKCIAQAGSGLYQDANSSQELQNALEQVQMQVVQDSQVILTPTPTQPVSVSKLTLEQIQNMQWTLPISNEGDIKSFYQGPFTDGLILSGTDGSYIEYANGVSFISSMAEVVFGDLNRDNLEDAAIIVSDNFGGLTNHSSLVIVVNENGEPRIAHIEPDIEITTWQLNIKIQNNLVILDGFWWAPTDSNLGPTQKVKLSYRLTSNGLEKVAQ